MEKQNLEFTNNEFIHRDRLQFRLIKDSAVKEGQPLTSEVQKMYGARGAKFISELENIKFRLGEQVLISENNTIELYKKSWGPYRKGVVNGDYPLFFQINYGKPWRNESYLKIDILLDRIRVKRTQIR